MRILFDTNIVLDVLLNREPFVTEAKALWEANDNGRLVGYISASSLTDIFYVARRIAGVETARTAVRVCLDAFEICEIDRAVLEHAFSLGGTDFEDDLQIACAHFADIDAIATRDKAGFSESPVLAATPAEVLSKL